MVQERGPISTRVLHGLLALETIDLLWQQRVDPNVPGKDAGG